MWEGEGVFNKDSILKDVKDVLSALKCGMCGRRRDIIFCEVSLDISWKYESARGNHICRRIWQMKRLPEFERCMTPFERREVQ